MQRTKNVEAINSRLIKYLTTIPFPYSDVLKEQLSASLYTNTFFQDYYCIHFQLMDNTNPLPCWIDAMPLSWQILIDGIPLQFQLFVHKGYIDKLEIVDFGKGPINWEKLWSSPPLLDYEFDIQRIINHFADKEIVINKVSHKGTAIDLDIELGGKQFLACFRGCDIRTLILNGFPQKCKLCISDPKEKSCRFTVSSDAGDVDFDCASIFIHWHAVLG